MSASLTPGMAALALFGVFFVLLVARVPVALPAFRSSPTSRVFRR